MTNFAGLPSYFWFTSSRPKESAQDDVPYTNQALKQDLLRVRNAWEECQASRARDAIYCYLTAVFDLVAWWVAENGAIERAQKALRLHNIDLSDHDEPFAAVIRCTSDAGKVDKRTRSKWSRVLRYAREYKSHSEPLDAFIKRKGGINKCASRLESIFGMAGLSIAQATDIPSLRDLTIGYVRDQHHRGGDAPNDLATRLASVGLKLPPEIETKSHADFAGLFAPVLLAASARERLALEHDQELLARRTLREDPVYVSAAWRQLLTFYGSA
jgi:hypothetical protein